MKSMKKLQLTLILCLIAAVSWAQGKETRELSPFTKISVGQAIKVYVEKGAKESCVIEAEGIDTRSVLTDVGGRTLRIRLDRDRKRRNIDVVVRLTYNKINAISISSAARVYSNGTIKTDDMEIEVSSAGRGELDVDVDELEVEVSSSGNLEITGNARYQDINISSAGSLDAYGLDCEEVSASVSSAGKAKVQASKRIDARANSAGSIRYKGNPDKAYVSANSGGSIQRAN